METHGISLKDPSVPTSSTLDVGCFQPFKHYHAEATDNAMQSDEGDFGKLEFLAKFQAMRTQNFKKSTIQSAFRRTILKLYFSKFALFQDVYGQLPRLHPTGLPRK